MNRVVIASIFMGGRPHLLGISCCHRLDTDYQKGIQMYWGGQAIRIILGSIIGPRFTNMENTLPASANITTLDLICFFIFIFVLGQQTPPMHWRYANLLTTIIVPALWVKPEKLQVPFRVRVSRPQNRIVQPRDCEI